MKLGRIEPTLPKDIEKELANHVKDMLTRFHEITGMEVRKLALMIATEKNIDHKFNSKSRMAGPDWLRSFRRRHNLSLRVPQPTNLSRLIGFNKPKVQQFFSLLDSVYKKHNYSPQNVYNCDETIE